MKTLINNEMYTFSFYVHSVKTLDTKNLKVGQRRISLSRKNVAQFDYILLKIQMISF